MYEPVPCTACTGALARAPGMWHFQGRRRQSRSPVRCQTMCPAAAAGAVQAPARGRRLCADRLQQVPDKQAGYAEGPCYAKANQLLGQQESTDQAAATPPPSLESSTSYAVSQVTAGPTRTL